MLVDLETWKYSLLKPLSFVYLGFSGCLLSLSPVTLDLYSFVTSWKAFWVSFQTEPTIYLCHEMTDKLPWTKKPVSVICMPWIPWPGPVSAGVGKQPRTDLQVAPAPLWLRRDVRLLLMGVQGWWEKTQLFRELREEKGCQETTKTEAYKTHCSIILLGPREGQSLSKLVQSLEWEFGSLWRLTAWLLCVALDVEREVELEEVRWLA